MKDDSIYEARYYYAGDNTYRPLGWWHSRKEAIAAIESNNWEPPIPDGPYRNYDVVKIFRRQSGFSGEGEEVVF